MSLAPSTPVDVDGHGAPLGRAPGTVHGGWQARAYGWLLVILLSLPAVIPTLTQPIEDRGADGFLHIYRSVSFSEARDNSWLWPRWASSLNAGLGSPVLSFYSPGAYFAVDVLRRVGLPRVLAWRTLLALAAVAAAAGAYSFALAAGRNSGLAVFAATAYLYAPALLRDLWSRGSPQGLVVALLPWVLLALKRLAERPSGARISIAAVLIGSLVLTHNLTAVLVLPIVAVFVLFLLIQFRTRALYSLTVAFILGTLMAAIHVGPFLWERDFVQLSLASGSVWAQPEHQTVGLVNLGLRSSAPDTGIPNANAANPALVNMVQIVTIGFLIGCTPFTLRHARTGTRLLFLSGMAVAVLVIGMQLDISTPIWRLPGLSMLQFRWRLLSLVGPGILLSFAAVARLPQLLYSTRFWAAASLVVLALSLPRLYPGLLPVVHVVDRNATAQELTEIAFRSGNYDLSTGEFQPIWREWGYSEEEMKWAGLTPIANLPEGSQWLTDVRTTRSRTTRFSSPVAFDASLHLLYFPGWQVTVDGQPATAYPSEGGGYLTVPVPAGEHEIVAYYGGTPVQHLSAAISGLAVLACVVLAIVWRPHAAEVPAEPVALERPRWEVAAVIALLVAAKLLWIDPHTTLFRHASTRDAIYGATAQVEVAFDNAILLHGYRLDDVSLEPGQEVEVTLYWSADGFPDRQYPGSFVHLLGDDLNEARGDYLWGQSDSRHRPGRWEQGKLFADLHTLTVDASAPAGPYSLEIGWWWPDTGRLFQAEIRNGPATLRTAEPGYLILSGLEVVGQRR